MSYSRSYSCGADPYGVGESPPPYTPSAEWSSYPTDSHRDSFGPIHNPVVPYTTQIPPIRDGTMLLFQGFIPANSKRFSINLKQGSDEQAVNAMHVNPRFERTNQVIRNSYIYGCWGPDEREGGLPLVPGEKFECIIQATTTCFKIAFNGHHFQNYEYRVPKETINHLHVEGNVLLHLVRYQGPESGIPSRVSSSYAYPAPVSQSVQNIGQKPKIDPVESTRPMPKNHGPKGKYFYISSELHRVQGMVVDVEGTYPQEGNRVIMKHIGPSFSEMKDTQIWYEHRSTGTIRNKANDMCLDAQGDMIIVSKYTGRNFQQMMMISENRFQLRHNPKQTLGVNEEPGRVCLALGNYTGEAYQQWNTEYLPPCYFWVKSRMNGKVLDVKGKDPTAGTAVVMWSQTKPATDNQLWYEDRDGIIKSKLNNYALDATKYTLRMMPYDRGNCKMNWVITGEKVHLKHQTNLVLDIRGKNPFNGASVVEYEYKGTSNQQWFIENFS